MDSVFNFLDLIRLQIEYNYFFSIIIFILFLFVYFSFSLPGNILLMVSAGYFFGVYIGYLISIITLVLGSLLFSLFSSFFLKKIFPTLINKYSTKVDQYISKSSIEYLIIFRMIPGPPLMFQNLILSLLKITKIKFIISSFMGFTPLVFVLAFFGHQLNNFNNLKNFNIADVFSIEFILFLLLIIIFLAIRILYKKK